MGGKRVKGYSKNVFKISIVASALVVRNWD